MHIKKLTIRGFKSYSEQLEVDDFSEHHNVVVGRNGSGKSNFFQAICFVLCDDNFENLRKEERVELLHEGTGQRTLTAFVEILFDNADKRLPYDTDEVSLRRMIGLQRDEFFVNGKQMSKTDVVNMLESAGFSRSNPYYIVKQGKVNALALMSNKQRLQLLKEVAGTKVYEDRRAQSVKLFQQSIKKRENTKEINRYIETSRNIYDLPLFIDETPAITVATLCNRARRIKRLFGVSLIVVDYIQLMRAPSSNRNDNRVQEVSEITQGLKALAKELKVPVLALSQLSRAVEQRDEKKPQLSDLRESGSIEQDADVVMFVYREAYYLENKQPKLGSIEHAEWQSKMNDVNGLADIILGKQRHGPTGVVKVEFEGIYTKFKDLSKN